MPEALIWGASSEMVRPLIQTLSQAGWRLYAAARDVDGIPAEVDEQYRYTFRADSLNDIQDIAIDVAHSSDGLDLWVYAAGSLHADLLKKMDPASWSSVLNANLNGAFYTSSQTIHLLNEGAQAMFIGAYVDHLILPKMGAYAVAKAGLETLVEVLQKENRKLNFTLVKPGAVATRFWQSAPFKMPADAKQPEAVASAMLTWQDAKKRGVLAL